MWLINIETMKLEYFTGPIFPSYAILSHTWEGEEVSFQEFVAASPATLSKKGYYKIQKTCEIATRRGLGYAWVDTCCIDKSSSAELSESINSMFQWYEEAHFCIAFLSDMPSQGSIDDHLPKCRWFTRGWTLQELIAPQTVHFFNEDWGWVGRKHELRDIIHSITGISAPLLARDMNLQDFSIAERMSWAANRQTTRLEDIAYCLLGIFDIRMPLLYGEGAKAFHRLQEEIVKSFDDASIFAWADIRNGVSVYAGLFASSPFQFANCTLPPLREGIVQGISVTSMGIHTRTSLGVCPSSASARTYVLRLGRVPGDETAMIGVYLRQLGPSSFVRFLPQELPLFNPVEIDKYSVEPIYIATKLPLNQTAPGTLDIAAGAIRTSALEVSLANHAGINTTGLYPLSHWDVHDHSFFAISFNCQGWAIFGVSGTIRITPNVEAALDLLCICFNWNSGTSAPEGFVVNRQAQPRHPQIILHLYLLTMDFEHDGNVRDVVVGEFGKLEEVAAIDATGQGRPRKATARLNFKDLGDSRADMCQVRTTRVELDIRLEEGEGEEDAMVVS